MNALGVVFGGAAAALQATAYVLYVRGALGGRIDPNPTSWLMWAYGTLLVVVLESDRGIAPILRALPVVCAACSIVVAILCCRTRGAAWDIPKGDRPALYVDLGLTALYVGVVAWTWTGGIAERWSGAARTALLLTAATSTLISFLPILASTRAQPEREDLRPWLVWTAAYLLLLVATLLREGISTSALAFAVYPAMCAFCSGAVASYLIPRRTPAPRRRAPPSESRPVEAPPTLGHLLPGTVVPSREGWQSGSMHRS